MHILNINFHENYKLPGRHRRGAAMDDVLDGRKDRRVEGEPLRKQGRALHVERRKRNEPHGVV